jgi:hypothetical protein
MIPGAVPLKLPKHPMKDIEKVFEHLRQKYSYKDGDVYNNETNMKVKINQIHRGVSLYCGNHQKQFSIDWIRMFHEFPEKTPPDLYCPGNYYVLHEWEWIPRSKYMKNFVPASTTRHVINPVRIIAGPDRVGKIYSSLTTMARELNIDPSNACKVLKGKLTTCKGYSFEYVNPIIDTQRQPKRRRRIVELSKAKRNEFKRAMSKAENRKRYKRTKKNAKKQEEEEEVVMV